MHEYSIVQALLQRVEQEAQTHRATAVHHVRVRIGEASGVENDLLISAWEMVRERSCCSAADLEIVPVAVRWKCPGCGREIRAGEILRCPTCERPARLDGGDEILLDRVELEVA